MSNHPHSNSGKSTSAPLACYSNYFDIGHNLYEFLIDFGQYQPESESVVLHTRIAVGPPHAKLLLKMLHDAVSRYEKEHGELDEIEDQFDPMEVILKSLPDFERRAVSARNQPSSFRRAKSEETLAEQESESDVTCSDETKPSPD